MLPVDVAQALGPDEEAIPITGVGFTVTFRLAGEDAQARAGLV